MKRSATSHWQGTLKQGQGTLSTESGVLNEVPYSFAKRFENERGTNPEELIGAAHSGCFAMALSGELEKKNLKAETIDVKAQVTLENLTISAVHLSVTLNVPGANKNQIDEAAQIAKKNCPVSRLLKAEITMEVDHLSSSPEMTM